MCRSNKMLLFGIVFIISLLGCGGQEDTQYIELDNSQPLLPVTKKKTKTEGQIVLALGATTTPKQAYGYYQQLIRHLEEKIKQPIIILDKESYAEINALLRSGGIDVAFVCGGPYVDGHDEFGLELLVAPQVQGKVKYHSHIIVHKDSDISKLEGLKGKTFAFTDPMSNSGRLVPTYILYNELHTTPETFFEKLVYSGSHDNSISMVAAGIVDGAAVDSLIWDHLNEFNPVDTAKTKIIRVSSPYGIPPVAVSPQLDKLLKIKLKQLFLNMHQDIKGKEILKNMRIEKFVAVDDSNYDDIREIKKLIQASLD